MSRPNQKEYWHSEIIVGLSLPLLAYSHRLVGHAAMSPDSGFFIGIQRQYMNHYTHASLRHPDIDHALSIGIAEEEDDAIQGMWRNVPRDLEMAERRAAVGLGDAQALDLLREAARIIAQDMERQRALDADAAWVIEQQYITGDYDLPDWPTVCRRPATGFLPIRAAAKCPRLPLDAFRCATVGCVSVDVFPCTVPQPQTPPEDLAPTCRATWIDAGDYGHARSMRTDAERSRFWAEVNNRKRAEKKDAKLRSTP